MKKIIPSVIALALALAGPAAATPRALVWGLDTAFSPANVCLYYTSAACFNIGTMSAGGQYLLPVGMGGTGLITGTSGGIPYFSSSSAMGSSAALGANAIVIGGGAGAAPSSLGSLGTTSTVLHGNASGAPSFGAVALATDVSGTVQAANFPALTGAVTTPGGSLTTSIASGATVPTPVITGDVTAATSQVAGAVGEVLTYSAATVSVTTATPKTIASGSLSAGHWMCFGQGTTNPAAGTTTSSVGHSISLTNNVMGSGPGTFSAPISALAAVSESHSTGGVIFNFTAPTTVYLVSNIAFATSTMTVTASFSCTRFW